MITRLAAFSLFSALLFMLAVLSHAQQIADPEFKPTVAHPAYSKNGPRVLFDEAHNNFHTTHGRYKPFADLLTEDGYYVVASRKPFTKESLATFKVMVIADALGAEEMDDDGADHPAFADEECDAVRDWVRGGGALLLVVDRAPFNGAADTLAKRFNVDLSKGPAVDQAHVTADRDNPGLVVSSRESGLLLDHPITGGRNDSEKINRVIAFTGQTLKGPEGSTTFLKIAVAAPDPKPAAAGADASAGGVTGVAQGIAFKFGKGRVVVLGEAAMLSAQIVGRDRRPVGMNYPDVDNKQLALNIVHWLSGALRER
jgi:hypothetical protein